MDPKRGWSSWSTATRVLVILGISTSVFIVVTGALGGYGAYWLYSAGDQTDTRFVIGEEARAYVHLSQSVEDPGIGETMTRIGEAYGRLQKKEIDQSKDKLPAPVRAMMNLSQQDANFSMFFPRSATLSVEVTGDEVRWFVGVNPRGMGGFIKGAFGVFGMDGESSDMKKVEHEGHTIIETSSTAWSHEGSTVLVAGTIDEMKRVVDRVVKGAPVTPHPKMIAMEKQVSPGTDAFAVLMEPAGLPEIAEVDLDGVAVLGVGLDVVTADRWEVDAVVEATGEGDVSAVAARMREILDRLRDDLAKETITLSYRESPVGPRTLRFEVDVLGIGTAIARQIEEPTDHDLEEALE